MKILAKQIYTRILLMFNIFFPRFAARNILCWDVRIRSRGKVVKFKNAYLHKTRINVSGQQCKLFIKGGMYNTTIEVYGDNNRIICCEGCKIHDTTVIMRGNNLLLYIGKQSAIGGGRIVIMGQSNKVTIGTNCMLSDRLEIWSTDSHPIYDIDKNVINPSVPVIVADNVWIGSHATVLKGVTIGEGAIVGMNAVVTRDVPSNSVCVGNPAKVIKSNVSWKREYISV